MNAILTLLVLCITGLSSIAQKTDSLKLLCPLNNAVEPPAEKKSFDMGAEQPKLFLTSATDTTVKACISGTVTNIMRDEEGKYEVMFHNKDHYFWYSGLTKATVRKGQKLQAGEAIGLLTPGHKMELMLYDFETPVDPKKFLNCGK